ncbi:GNAT family N-acetyltransferase [Pontibacillus marinus]|uniref:N-acetyltransferase domain-containing protein n=1 Tax=Pontibacillus marinus BH030004 = DSM 16465 TaxID=1385511 RepID=A0A0A5G3W4_9BACI|nr:GNAT family N-acetyltransferase [Pontibacillus marinus]KGX85833.1 hypothetical protein N783_13800 [Pontibacillus marinus BH030004 = DSM 16465]
MKNVALVTVLHDPSGKILSLFRRLQSEVEALYSNLYITISNETNDELCLALERSHFNIKVIPKKGAAHARREVIQFGLEGDNHYYHYCDFDRLLTWIEKDKTELKEVIGDIPNHDFLVLGRTKEAFDSHPTEWRETENITNKIFSLELGQQMDITAGTCAFSRECSRYIQKYSEAAMTDAEWPMIVHRIAGMKVNERLVNGLAYLKDINGENKEVSDSQKWVNRLKLSYIISETAISTGKALKPLDFHTIDTSVHRETILAFRKGSFIASFGHDRDFGDEENYVQWVSGKVRDFPTGFVMVYESGEAIGQLELQVKEFEAEKIGYINLYYLIPERRGRGYGKVLHDYAMEFFKKHHIGEYHLRVAPDNHQAISFYKRNGMEEMYPEVDGKVIRMRGFIT